MPKPNHHIFADGELSRNEGTLRIDTLDGDTEYLPVESVDALYLHGQIDFNTRALGLLNDHSVPLHVFGWKDYYRGSYLPKRDQTSGNTVVEQVRAYDNPARRLHIAQKMIQASIHNMRGNIRYYDGRRGDFAADIEALAEEKETVSNVDSIDELRAVEGNARKTYYGCFDRILRDPFTLTKREFNPPSNEANALVSFLNGMVYTTCVSAIRKTALDPTVGFVHAPSERRFTLSLDVADIFKPILADRLVFRLVNRRQLSPDDFEEELDGCLLTEDGRLTVLEEFEETLDETVEHPRLNRKVSFKTLVQTDVYSLKKHVLTDEPYHVSSGGDKVYVIVVYDVPADRTRIYRKLLRKRLEHLQHSVLFGELTRGQVTTLKNDIDNKLQSDDSVIIFKSENPASFEYSTFGEADEPGSRFT